MNSIRRAFTRPVVFFNVPLLLVISGVLFYNAPTPFTFHVYPNGETNSFTETCQLRPGSEVSEASVYRMVIEGDELLETQLIMWHKAEVGATEPCVGDVTFALQWGTDYFSHLKGYPTATHIAGYEVKNGSMRVGYPIEIWKKATLTVNLRDVATAGCKKLGLDWECSGFNNLRFDDKTGECSASAGSKYASLLYTSSFHPFEFQGLSTASYRAPTVYDSEPWTFEDGSESKKQPTIICSIKSEFDLDDDPDGYQVQTKWGILRYSYAKLESTGWNMVVGASDYKLFRE